MIGAAQGLGAFIEGYVRGETMKRERGRQDKYDAQADEDRQRRHRIQDEELGWRREDRAIAAAERARVASERQFYEDLYRKAAEAADAPPAAAPGARPPRTLENEPVMQPSAPLTFGALGARRRPATEVEQSVLPPPPPSPSGAPNGSTPGTDPMTGLPTPTYFPGTDPRQGASMAESDALASPGAGQPAAAASPFGALPQKGTPTGAEPSRVTDAAPGGAPGTTKGTTTAPAPERQAVAAVAADTLRFSSAPSMNIVDGAGPVPTSAPGARKGPVFTEGQMGRATDDFMERYMEFGAPTVIRGLLEKGQFEQAQKFQEFLDMNSTREGLKSWARATFRISVGDFDGFADELIEAYNQGDYFPDGISVNKDESGFTKDDAGNITGAKVVFEADDGTKFEQVFDSPDDLVRFGITQLAPENAFQWYLQQLETAQGALLDAQTRAASSRQPDADKARLDRVAAVEKMLADADPGWMARPAEEREAMVREALERQERLAFGAVPGDGDAPGAAPSAPPPVLYRQ